MKLAINLATRGRPQLLTSTIMRTAENIRDPATVFMISADVDDQPTVNLLDQLIGMGVPIVASVRDREDTVAAKWNRALALQPDADVYMPMCDDGPAITPGFDQRILAAAAHWPDGIGVVFNHLENLSFTGVQAVTRRLAELMGCIYPEFFPYWFVDHWLSDIAEMIDRVAFADVRLDCASNRNAGGPTMEMREPAFWATFYDACHLRRRHQAHYIIGKFLEIPDWQKAILLERHPLIEEYSKMINDGVRAMQLSPNPPDARYKRIKAAAQALLKSEILPELEADVRAA